MYVTKNSLLEKVRIQVSEMLQVHLSNSLDLTTQAKQAHWNIKGPDFISLHELFDQIAEGSEEYSDLIAERIVQLGGIAEGTLRSAAKKTQLPDYPLNISSSHAHINALAHTLSSYGENIRNAASRANEIMDHGTADMLTHISLQVDKSLWLVEAHTQGTR